MNSHQTTASARAEANAIPCAQTSSLVDAIFASVRAGRATRSWDTISSMARLVITPDERPIRTIITGRRRIVTGIYPSRKAGRSFPHEGMNEQAFFMHSEVDTRVVDYRAQPFRFEFVLNGVKRIYIADCARLLDDGTIEVVEVKGDPRALEEPDYAQKLRCVADICAKLGWRFRAVMRDQLLLPKIRFANIVEVQSRRNVKFDESHGYRAFDLLSRSGGAVTLGELADCLGGPPLGMAIAKAMVVGRLIDIDLVPPLASDSLVRAVQTVAQASGVQA